jgi:hypothetical protein
MVGGFALGYFLEGRRIGERRAPQLTASPPATLPPPLASRLDSSPTLRPSGVGPVLQSGPSFEGSSGKDLLGRFDDELSQVKALVIGALMGFVRDLAKESLPPALAPQIEQIMDSTTAKLGGKPVESPIVATTAGNGWHTTNRN